jgi:hypothetical protein
MGWKTGVCQQEHNQHDDTGSGAHPASDVQLQCSHIQLSVVKCMSLLQSMELEFISSLFGNKMQRRTGPDLLPEHFRLFRIFSRAGANRLKHTPASHRTVKTVGAKIFVLICQLALFVYTD